MATDKEVNLGFEFLDAMPRYRRVDANVRLMSDAVHAENRTITPDVLRQIFARIQPQFAINPEYAGAYRTFFKRHPEYALQTNLTILDAKLAKLGEALTADNLEELLLPGNPHNVVDQLAITASAAEAKAEAQRQKAAAEHEAKETTRMVAEITAYMLGHDGKVKREYTQRQYNDKIAGLRAMSFAELTARYDAVMAARQLRQAPVEQLRATVKTDTVQRRQALSRYEKLPDLYYPPGKDVGVPWSQNLFRRLPTQEQRRLLAHYGDEQLTAAINAAKGK